MERRGSILAGLAQVWASRMVDPGWPGSGMGLTHGPSWLSWLKHRPRTWASHVGLRHNPLCGPKTWVSHMWLTCGPQKLASGFQSSASGRGLRGRFRAN